MTYRNGFGDGHHNSKLSTLEVAQIRALRTSGEKIEAIAARFSWVSQNTVTQVIHKTTYKHVPWWYEWTLIYGEEGGEHG